MAEYQSDSPAEKQAQLDRDERFRRNFVKFGLPFAGLGMIGGLSFAYIQSESNDVLTWKDMPEVVNMTLDAERYFELQTQLGSYATSNSCAIDTPFIGEYAPNLETPEQTSDGIISFIKETYGIDVVFNNETILLSETTDANLESDRQIESLKMFNIKDRVRDLVLLQQTLSRMDPRVIKAAGIETITLAGALNTYDGFEGASSSEKPGSGSDWAGFIFGPDVYVSARYDDEYMIQTYLHEFYHRISDQLLCSDADEHKDAAFSDNATIPYKSEDTLHDYTSDSPLLFVPGPTQEFASRYSLEDVDEDRAEVFADMVAGGLILPWDASWGSPLQLKQAELLQREEAMTPGYTEALIKQTIEPRQKSDEATHLRGFAYPVRSIEIATP